MNPYESPQTDKPPPPPKRQSTAAIVVFVIFMALLTGFMLLTAEPTAQPPSPNNGTVPAISENSN